VFCVPVDFYLIALRALMALIPAAFQHASRLRVFICSAYECAALLEVKIITTHKKLKPNLCGEKCCMVWIRGASHHGNFMWNLFLTNCMIKVCRCRCLIYHRISDV
jgi:hypothetical protein